MNKNIHLQSIYPSRTKTVEGMSSYKIKALKTCKDRLEKKKTHTLSHTHARKYNNLAFSSFIKGNQGVQHPGEVQSLQEVVDLKRLEEREPSKEYEIHLKTAIKHRGV